MRASMGELVAFGLSFSEAFAKACKDERLVMRLPEYMEDMALRCDCASQELILLPGGKAITLRNHSLFRDDWQVFNPARPIEDSNPAYFVQE